eukprot:CAMPEP_0197028776 /NCGR_PEP_ID=MMETSP1384-20130603/8383_1 /TAXON_ID=29189 /ORGANISM="Ammonia sp." /LENGTH=440 /DNA_ID=CAMNT_0042457831 /DNA_START=39 /DNA_END=1361 /DNA_ORIENTATION=+
MAEENPPDKSDTTSPETGQNRMCLGGRFNPGDLKTVKLKKTKKSQEQIQKEKTKFAKQLCEDANDYYRLVKETYFENYYEKIKDLTFATEYIELSKDDCKTLMNLHQEYLKWDKEQTDAQQQQPADDEKEKKDEDKTGIPGIVIKEYNYDRSAVQALIDKIDAIKKAKQWKHIFIRMSIRSPKDAALTSPKFSTILKREYESLHKFQGKQAPKQLAVSGGDRDEIWDINQRVIACYRAQTFALSCDAGQEAIDLLVRSPRIQGDMKSYAIDGEYEQKFQLIVRDFQFFDVSFEFRTFIYNKKMTGLTQYNDLCYFDDLVQFQAEIVAKVQQFVNDVIARIQLDSFVLDIVLVDADYDGKSEWPPLNKERLQKLKVMIIEINPMAEFAGGGLFEWNKDKDVLLGQKPFEFRMQTKLSSYITADLMPEWHPFIFGNNKKLIK